MYALQAQKLFCFCPITLRNISQESMGFIYIEVLVKVIFTYVEATPYIPYVVEEFSKFSEKPAECHYVYIKSVIR